jgi:hypothetical protein
MADTDFILRGDAVSMCRDEYDASFRWNRRADNGN